LRLCVDNVLFSPRLLNAEVQRRRGAENAKDHGKLKLLWLYRHSRLNPRVVPAIERMNILPTVIDQNLRHTGARCFVRSSAVGDYGAIFGNFSEMLLYFISRNAN